MSQQWLPIITETSKIQCTIVIPEVLDENQYRVRKNDPYFHLVKIDHNGISIF